MKIQNDAERRTYELNPEMCAVSDIVNGLCESLKNVNNYRLFMHQEIRDILNRQMFITDKKSIPVSWMPIREEE